MATRHYTRRSGDLEIYIDMGPADSAVRFLESFGRQAEAPIARAINRAVAGVVTDAVSGIRDTYNVRAADVRRRIETRKARANAGGRARVLSGRVGFSGSAMPLVAFAPLPSMPVPKKPPRVGVSVRVKKARGRKKIPGAFVADLPVRGRGVYYRPGPDRNKVLTAYTLSVPQMLGDDTADRITDGAQVRFSKTMDHEIDRFLSKAGVR